MKFKEFFKLAVLVFILTEIMLPRPMCIGWGGQQCGFTPPLLGFIHTITGFYGWKVFWMDTLVVLLISLLTASAFLYFKKRKVLTLGTNIKTQKIKSWVLFLVIWILIMVIFLIP